MLQAWMLYGANGYTGELIARAAAARGLSPVLAGRNRAAITALADELGLPSRVFGLGAADLSGMSLVLNCAGPFSATAVPMMEACLHAGAHYLDITGEIEVFEQAWTRGERARSAGVVLCPGVGFDVIPTDCVAAALKQALPDASRLELAFSTRSPMSAGTAKTAIEALAQPGRIRRGGRLVAVPQAWQVRQIDFGDGPQSAMPIAWGDVSTAFRSTGIPDITVYAAVPPMMLRAARLAGYATLLLGAPQVQALLKRSAARIKGPDDAARAKFGSLIWGEATNPAGTRRTARLRTGNGYDVTVAGALAVAGFVIGRNGPGGAFTPSLLMGAELAQRLPGATPIRIE
jgi:short subunit dehydrogenase-like uncharacterized protein